MDGRTDNLDRPMPRDHGSTDADAVEAVSARQGPVRLYSPRTHVQARLTLELGAERLAGTVPVAQLAGVLARVLPLLTAAEAGEVMVVHDADGPVWIESATTARHRLETPWLPRLLTEGGMSPWFQPIADLRTGAVFGREALVRATVGGLMHTGREIVDAAAAHGLVVAFDQQARADAIRLGTAMLAPSEMLCVNVVPDAVDDPEVCLAPTWQAARSAGLDAGRLCFELVRTEGCADHDLLRALCNHLRDRGALVALDDLGAGWAAMSALRKLRPDLVKLDRALTFGLSYDATRQRVVSALVDHAHEHAVRVVAHGVEDPDDLTAAAALGVDYAQGYLVASPTPWMDGLPMSTLEALRRLR